MSKGHVCIWCKQHYTNNRYVCYGCLQSKKTEEADFDNAIREFEAGRSYSTPHKNSPYNDAVRALARSIPTTPKKRAAFINAMNDAYKKGSERRAD